MHHGIIKNIRAIRRFDDKEVMKPNHESTLLTIFGGENPNNRVEKDVTILIKFGGVKNDKIFY
jgi:hypothetical protein